MKIKSSAFEKGKIHLNFGKFAEKKYLVDGLPKTSFDLSWELNNPEGKYMHILFIDYDAIPVVAMPFLHWSVANIEVSKFPKGLSENASIQLEDQLIQGINSLALEDTGKQEVLENAHGFIGSMPPNSEHTYNLLAWTTKEPLNLKNGFWVNEMINELEKTKIIEKAKLLGTYPSILKK